MNNVQIEKLGAAAWTKELTVQNAYFQEHILKHRAEIAALLAKPFTADQFAGEN